jgi:hypothetical protein
MTDKGSSYLPPTYLWDNYFNDLDPNDSQDVSCASNESNVSNATVECVYFQDDPRYLEQQVNGLLNRYPGLLEIRTRMTLEQFCAQVKEKNPDLYATIMKEELIWRDVWERGARAPLKPLPPSGVSIKEKASL